MTRATWNPLVALEPRTTWLLEASAGTGKTFQIAGLFVRLVAEYDVPIQKILAITFTNAATAELRDRIRARLQRAHERLSEDPEPGETDNDPILSYLRARPDVERQRLRLQLALREFDQAPVSTIHSFAQRMLKELAFESNQDLGLELLSNARLVQEQLVDDALANVYASAGARELVLYQRAGFERRVLCSVAAAMCGPTAHRVAPAVVLQPSDELALVKAQTARVDAMRACLTSEQGRADLQVLLADSVHLKGHPNGPGNLPKWLSDLEQWLERGADATLLPPLYDKFTAAKNLRAPWFEERWGHYAKSSPPPSPTQPLHSRPWWPIIEALDRFYEDTLAFHASFAPLASFASSVRGKFQAELARRQELTFDDMLSKLAVGVSPGTEGAEVLAARIRERFDVVFVDEFQDTDVAQWTVIKAAFHGHARLFLIGDPKQAIYAFRGADVNVYLAASADVAPDGAGGAHPPIQTMGDNWRSDPAAVEAMNQLWQPGSEAFEVPRIDYVRVRPNLRARLLPSPTTPSRAGLELRWVDARVRGGGIGERIGHADVALTAKLAAEEVHAWLSGVRGELLVERTTEAGEKCEGRRTPVPSDIAVLVQDHRQARAVRRELGRLRIPAVSASKHSVFESDAARWLEAWLRAVASGGRDREARTAATTPLVGWTGDELAWSLALAERSALAVEEARRVGRVLASVEGRGIALDRDWNTWTERLRKAAERWPKLGFARTFDRELVELSAMPRVLAMPDGERRATDLRHLLELLHVEERERRLGPGPLADWLNAQVEVAGDNREQRLESDDDAVRVETIHVSKGLEYPVVLLPYAWTVKSGGRKKFEPIVLREASGSHVDLHPPGLPARAAAEGLASEETRREEIRKLYVALTRARHRTIAWWGPIGDNALTTAATPLGRLVMRGDGERGYDRTPVADFKADPATAWGLVKERLVALRDRADGAIAFAECEAPKALAPLVRSQDHAASVPCWPSERLVPNFSRRWSVTSYSGLAKGVAALDRDERLLRDAPRAADMLDGIAASDAGSADAVAGGLLPSLLLLEAPPRLKEGGGTVFGTFVHEVFEDLDFTRSLVSASGDGPDGTVAAAFGDRVRAIGARNGFAASSAEVADVALRMPDWLTTPLDAREGARSRISLPADYCLARLAKKDRLDELSFDLRLGNGTRYRREPRRDGIPDAPLDARAGAVDPRKVYDALRREKSVPEFEPWLLHQETLEKSGKTLIGSIAGILTGSIDLVFRVEQGGASRYFLADYKTNKIEASAPGHFTGPWLDWKMATAGYVLQSLLYTVALHRHLRLRLGASRYAYEQNFGGVLYLFVRGMAGPTTPRCEVSGHALGVHGHRWSPEVVHALDEALAGAEPMAAGARAKGAER
jgi:exodeoxyribonuclease V beta subunit